MACLQPSGSSRWGDVPGELCPAFPCQPPLPAPVHRRGAGAEAEGETQAPGAAALGRSALRALREGWPCRHPHAPCPQRWLRRPWVPWEHVSGPGVQVAWPQEATWVSVPCPSRTGLPPLSVGRALQGSPLGEELSVQRFCQCVQDSNGGDSFGLTFVLLHLVCWVSSRWRASVLSRPGSQPLLLSPYKVTPGCSPSPCSALLERVRCLGGLLTPRFARGFPVVGSVWTSLCGHQPLCGPPCGCDSLLFLP